MYKFYILLLFPILVFSQDTITKPQHSVISLDKVKVVYRGIANPISVAVDNAKSYKVYGNGLKVDIDGNYILYPGSGLTTKIYVEITIDNDTIIVEEHEFKIKNIKEPIPTLNDEFSTQGLLHFTIEEVKNAELGIKFLEFLSEANTFITQFSIKIPRHPTIVIQGNTFTDEVFELLKKARKKDYIIINNIKANYMIGHALHKPIQPLVFKIVK